MSLEYQGAILAVFFWEGQISLITVFCCEYLEDKCRIGERNVRVCDSRDR